MYSFEMVADGKWVMHVLCDAEIFIFYKWCMWGNFEVVKFLKIWKSF
jgi:hypothetical protein